MTSKLGTVLPRRPVAWFWFVAAAFAATYFGWNALTEGGSWIAAVVFLGIAVLIYLEPRLGKSREETFQVDEGGVLRVEGDILEQIRWDDVAEIRIITTDEGPFREDVFFALGDAEGQGCLVPQISCRAEIGNLSALRE